MKKSSPLLIATAATVLVSSIALSAYADNISNYKWNLPNTTTPAAAVQPAGTNETTQTVHATEPELKNTPDVTSSTSQIQTETKSLSDNKTDTELAETVTRIGNKLLRDNNVQEQITFVLVNENVANASTDAQNTIRVYTGLLQYCTSEDELAFVIGHEIGHAMKNHVIKSVAIDQVAAVGTTVANKVVANQIAKTKINSKLNKWGFGSVLTNSATTAVNTTAAAGVAKLNRGQETDSDILGVALAAKAGYNPNASITILEKIGDNYVDFFEDHPSTDKRVEALKEYISKAYPEHAQK